LRLGLLLAIPALSQVAPKQVDAVFSAYDRSDSPGCAVGILKDGRVLYQRGYGLANLEHNVPITPRSAFHIASGSKPFTALSILLLEKDGQLSLEDPVRKYVPELPDYGRPLTIRHLLDHTSGLKDHLTLVVLAGKYYDDPYTPRQFLALIARQKALHFAPGDEWRYTNTGYFLAAQIVARSAARACGSSRTNASFFRAA
jgi:CubicO group peptidase (beta-lactamase class C family)